MLAGACLLLSYPCARRAEQRKLHEQETLENQADGKNDTAQEGKC